MNALTPQELAILSSSLVLSVVHGVVPNHWLPFVLVARAQGWTSRRTLWVAFAATSVHLGVTGVLAGLLMAFGSALGDLLHPLSHVLPGVIMVVVGVALLGAEWVGARHAHKEVHETCRRKLSDATATVSLILMLALSPCEAMAAVFLSAIPLNDLTFFVAVVLVAGLSTTVVIMGLVFLAIKGLLRVRTQHLVERERSVIGAALLLLGTVTLVIGLLA